jgi:methyl-accepting chemotaxis protein
MFRAFSRHAARANDDNTCLITALNRAQGLIWFDLDGKILDANDTLGTAAYRAFWEDLGQGKYQAGEFKRIDKSGRTRWLQASYNPIYDAAGKAYKIVKYATDITKEKNLAAENAGQMAAISKVQAVIEFDLEGKILTANENFCTTMGYSIDEIRGQRH